MNKQRMNEIYSDERFTLYAVESVDITHYKSPTSFTWHGNVKPTAIIIHSQGKNQALDMDNKPVEFEKLKESIPELVNILL